MTMTQQDNTNEELFRLVNDIEHYGKDWADKLEAATLLEETKTVVRAEIANRFRKEQPSMTKRDAEEMALISSAYHKHILAMVGAKRSANIARVMLEAARAKFDAHRTAEVSRRAELTKYQPR
jgi:hypothetical protein